MSKLQARLAAFRSEKEAAASLQEDQAKRSAPPAYRTPTVIVENFDDLPVGLEDYIPPHRVEHSERVALYVAKAVEEELNLVANAVEGTRNNQLNDSSFRLGQLCNEAYGLKLAEVAALILKAAIACGLSPGEARQTLMSGLKAGLNKPREPLSD